ncbi:CHAP domain-containing protein [Dictyobacter formicarum]|nr:CHAP domain-containing protein [Dictyobacter formicarum]
MKSFRRAFGCCTMIFFCLLIVVVIAYGTFTTIALQGGINTSPAPAVGPSNNAVVQMALAMARHLHCQPDPKPGLDCNDPRLGIALDAWYDDGFPPEVIQWAAIHCPGCAAWENGNFQCVVFVIASYIHVKPLPIVSENANQFWALFAHQPGWMESQQPLPGDIMTWAGGPFGHVSIVVAADAHSITFAQANAQMPVQTLLRNPDGTVNTHNGYWDTFTVQGYIRPAA